MKHWVCLLLLMAGGVTPATGADRELIVCGWDEVFILDAGDTSAATRKIWSWRAKERPELPAAYRSKFQATDECKPVSRNRILITASSDGVAIVDRGSGKTTFWAQCANAHSAELLPGDRVVVACSVRDPGGNRLALFDASSPEKELFSTELGSGHGAVWDQSRRTLWALGGRELRAYALAEWDSQAPRLRLEKSYSLPDGGGHELAAVPDSPMLVLTTNAGVWLFDRDTGDFKPHPELAGKAGVKGVSIHRASGRIAYIQADRPNWWSDTIHLLKPAGTIRLAGQRLYKARWVQ